MSKTVNSFSILETLDSDDNYTDDTIQYFSNLSENDITDLQKSEKYKTPSKSFNQQAEEKEFNLFIRGALPLPQHMRLKFEMDKQTGTNLRYEHIKPASTSKKKKSNKLDDMWIKTLDGTRYFTICSISKNKASLVQIYINGYPRSELKKTFRVPANRLRFLTTEPRNEILARIVSNKSNESSGSDETFTLSMQYKRITDKCVHISSKQTTDVNVSMETTTKESFDLPDVDHDNSIYSVMSTKIQTSTEFAILSVTLPITTETSKWINKGLNRSQQHNNNISNRNGDKTSTEGWIVMEARDALRLGSWINKNKSTTLPVNKIPRVLRYI